MQELQQVSQPSQVQVQHPHPRPYSTCPSTQVYSHKHNQDFSTPMLNTASRINPERSASNKALKGLDMRASHIPNMSDVPPAPPRSTPNCLPKRRSSRTTSSSWRNRSPSKPGPETRPTQTDTSTATTKNTATKPTSNCAKNQTNSTKISMQSNPKTVNSVQISINYKRKTKTLSIK